MRGDKTRVLVVDDRREYVDFLKKVLEANGEFEIVCVSDFSEVLRKVVLEFDVILLNVEMSEVSGLDILYQVMQRTETPVIVVTGDSEFSNEETLTALRYGAVDFWEINHDFALIESNRDKIIALIKSASLIRPKNSVFRKSEEVGVIPEVSDKFVVIGSSTGGPSVVSSILMSLPENFPAPIFVIQHMTRAFTGIFAKKLSKYCKVEVKEARNFEEVRKGVVYVAPGGFNLEIFVHQGKFFITLNNKKSLFMPSIDLTLLSAARAFGENVVSVILTGIGKDGSLGVQQVRARGGKVIVQDEESSVVFGMPKAVIENGDADFVVSGDMIGRKIVELL